MDEQDPLARHYDFDAINVDAAREQARRTSFNIVRSAIERAPSSRLPRSVDYSTIVSSLLTLGMPFSTAIDTVNLFGPYDSFEFELPIGKDPSVTPALQALEDKLTTEGDYVASAQGTKIESYLMHISTHYPFVPGRDELPINTLGRESSYYTYTDRTFELPVQSDNILLLVARAKGQQTVSLNNVKVGALQTRDGRTEFFKLMQLSDVEEIDRSLLLENLRLSVGDDPINRKILVAVRLNALDELSLANEFEKAAQAFKVQSEAREAQRLAALLARQRDILTITNDYQGDGPQGIIQTIGPEPDRPDLRRLEQIYEELKRFEDDQ